MLEIIFLGIESKADKIPYRDTCQPAIPLPLVELLLRGLFPQRNSQSSKIYLMGCLQSQGRARDLVYWCHNSQRNILWLLSYHKAVGPMASRSSRQQLPCRLALQATLANSITGFKVAGHVDNRATFPVHCVLLDKQILLRSLQRKLSSEMPGLICSGGNHSPAFKKC